MAPRSRTRSRASERLLPAVHKGDQGTRRQGPERGREPASACCLRSTREIKGHGAKVPNEVASQRAPVACSPRGKSRDMAPRFRTRSRASERLLPAVHEGDQGTFRQGSERGREPGWDRAPESGKQAPLHGARAKRLSRMLPARSFTLYSWGEVMVAATQLLHQFVMLHCIDHPTTCIETRNENED